MDGQRKVFGRPIKVLKLERPPIDLVAFAENLRRENRERLRRSFLRIVQGTSAHMVKPKDVGE